MVTPAFSGGSKDPISKDFGVLHFPCLSVVPPQD